MNINLVNINPFNNINSNLKIILIRIINNIKVISRIKLAYRSLLYIKTLIKVTLKPIKVIKKTPISRY